MNEMKCVNEFLYQYQKDGTVAIAKKAIFSNLSGQIQVNEKMAGVAKRTGYYIDMVHDGNIYQGIIFNAIPENKLIAALEQK